MTWPAYASSIVFIGLAFAFLGLCALLRRAGQHQVLGIVGGLVGAAAAIGFLLWAFDLVGIPIAALLFALVATFIAGAVLRPELRHGGQWAAIAAGTLMASVGAMPSFPGGTRAIRGTLIVAGFYLMMRLPGLIGKFLISRRYRTISRWWSSDDVYGLLIYLVCIAAMLMPTLPLAFLTVSLAGLIHLHQLLRRRR
jgi:hypothetical protein